MFVKSMNLRDFLTKADTVSDNALLTQMKGSCADSKDLPDQCRLVREIEFCLSRKLSDA